MTGTKDRRSRITPEQAKLAEAVKADMPHEPCFRCGARGWCGHNGRVAGSMDE